LLSSPNKPNVFYRDRRVKVQVVTDDTSDIPRELAEQLDIAVVPNYFGEVVHWWGIFIIGLGVAYGSLGIIGPLTIILLILKVSGIPLLEKNLTKNPVYLEYQKRTSSYVPLPPKKVQNNA
jgi:steroid 5-alpha reductase family enzyme